MTLPEAPDLGLLLVRTDYSDDEAWRAALSAATAVYEDDDFERGGALLRPIEAPQLSNLTIEELVSVDREAYLSVIAVADAQTMRDQTIAFVDLNELTGQVGRVFRSIASEVEPIVANLSIANMDFAEFADSIAPDGVFRGFGRAQHQIDFLQRQGAGIASYHFEDLPGWTFSLDERSAGVFVVLGVDPAGRSVQRIGIDPDNLLAQCREDALAISHASS